MQGGGCTMHVTAVSRMKALEVVTTSNCKAKTLPCRIYQHCHVCLLFPSAILIHIDSVACQPPLPSRLPSSSIHLLFTCPAVPDIRGWQRLPAAQGQSVLHQVQVAGPSGGGGGAQWRRRADDRCDAGRLGLPDLLRQHVHTSEDAGHACSYKCG